MVVFASLHRHWTAPAVAAAVGARKRSNSALPARSLGKGKELVAEKPARGEADPFAEFKSVLGEDEGFEAPYDPLRQGPLRYLGYSNEVGEAFRAWLFQGGVPLSYAVAISYVLFDTADKWKKALEEADNRIADDIPGVNRDRLVAAIGLECGFDTVVWQLLASVAIPGSTIHAIVALTSGLLERTLDEHSLLIQGLATSTALPADVLVQYSSKSLPTFVGLLAIPFIVHPIDNGVHALLNYTTRPLFQAYIINNGTEVCMSPSPVDTASLLVLVLTARRPRGRFVMCRPAQIDHII